MVGGRRHLFVDDLKHLVRGNDIEQHQLLHALGMVQRQAVGHARAAVVPHNMKRLKTQGLHHFDLVLSHSAFGIGEVFWVPGWLAAIAIAS